MKIGAKAKYLTILLLVLGLLVPVQQAWAQVGNTVLDKDASPNPATVGQPLTFTITETANATTPVQFLDAFIEGDFTIQSVTVDSPDPSANCTILSPTEVFCDLGTIPAGQTATVQIVVIPTAPGTITNTVLDSEGNFDEVTVQVNPAPQPPPPAQQQPQAQQPSPAPQQERQERQRQAQQQPAGGGLITQEVEQEAESGEVDLSFEVS